MATPTGVTAPARWTLSVRTTMMCLAVAVMVPLLLHLVLLISHSFTTTRVHAEEDRLEEATQAAHDVDNRLRMIRAGIMVAAGSTALAHAQLDAFHSELRLAIASVGLRAAVLFDTDGTVLLHSREPVQQPTQRMASVKELTETAASPGSVGNLIYSQLDGKPLLRVVNRVPLPNGRLGWLSFSIAPEEFAELGVAKVLAPGEVVAVRDRTGRLLWRSSPHQVGDPLPPGMAEAMEGRQSGVLRDIVTPSGDTVSIGFARAPISGLLVTSSLPLRRLYDHMPFGAHGTIAFAAASVGSSLMLALLLAGYLQRAFRRAAMGSDPGLIGVTEARELARDIRADRDMLLRTVSRLAVLEFIWDGARAADSMLALPSANFVDVTGAAADGAVSVATLLRLIHATDRQALSQALAAAFSEAVAFSLIVRCIHPLSGPRWLNIVGVPARISPGAMRRLVMSLEDITEEHTAAATRAANEKRLQLATEAAGIGVWEIELSTGRRYFSERLWALLGMEPRDPALSHGEMMALVHPDDRAKIERLDVIAIQEVAAVEFRMVLPVGGTRYWSGNASLLRDEDGVSTHIIGVLADITEQKLAELDLRSHASQLALAATIADIGIWERDQITGAARWIKLPEVFQRLNRDDRVPAGQDFLSMIHPDDHARLVREWVQLDPAKIEQMMRAPDGTPLDTSARQEIEFRGLAADGGIRHIQAKRVFLRGPAGDVTRTVGIFADITERRTTQQAIADREARFRLAVDAAALGTVTVDLRTRAVERSERLLEIWGLPATPEAVTEPYDYLSIHPDDRDAVVAAWEEWLAQGAHGRTQASYRIQHTGGSVRHVEALRMAERDADGQPIRIVTAVRDVTEAHAAALALRDSETRLRLATDAADLGIWDVDLQTGARIWSDRMWTLRGWQPRPDMPSLDIVRAIVLPEDQAILQTAWDDVNAGRDVLDYEFRIRLPDGTIRHLANRGRTIRDADGTKLRVVGVSADVTESRVAAQLLQDSETRFRLATDAAALGIWDVDLVTGTRVVSERMWHSLGLTPRPGAPDRAELLAVIPPEDHAALHRAWTEIAAGEDVIDYEYRIRLPNGDIRHIHGQGRTMRDPDGTRRRVTGISADVTDRRLAEQALAQRTTVLELAIEAADLGVWHRDPPSNTGAASARIWTMLGLQPQAGLHTRAEFLGAIHPDDRARVERDWVDNTAGGFLPGIEFRVVWPDGSIHHLASHRKVITGPDGHIQRVVGITADVTAQRRAEQQLARSEARFRLATDTAELGVWDYDPATGKTIWSARMWEFRGLPATDAPVTIEDISATTHPADRTRIETAIRAQRTGLLPFPLEREYRVIRSDGTERTILSRSVAVNDANGTLLRVVGVNRDITRERQAETTLRENEALFRLAIETAALGVYQMNIPARDGVWSERMHHARPPPRPGMPPIDEMTDMIHPEDRATLLTNRLSLRDQTSGAVSEYEFRVVWPNGTLRHLRARAFPMRDPDGTVRKIIGVNQDITEQKRVEQELRDNAIRYELATRAAGLAVWEHRVPGGERRWSPEMWALRGLPPRLSGPTDAEVLATTHPDDRATVMDLLAGLREHPAVPREAEYRILRADGALRTLNVKTTALRDPQGKVLRITGVAADVTEARQAQQALAASEARFRLAADTAELGVWQVNPMTQERAWSDRMWTIRGLPPQPEAPTIDAAAIHVHQEDRERVRQLLERSYRAPDTGGLEMDYRIIRPDGAIRTIRSKSVAMFSRDRAERVMLGVNLDVTERLAAEHALRESESLFRLAAEAASQGVWDQDRRTRQIRWSHRMWLIHGLEPRDTAPSRAEWEAMLHPDDHAAAIAMFARLRAHPANQVEAAEYRIRWPDGTIRHLDTRAMSVHDEDGKLVRFIGVVVDVTEVQDLRAQAAIAGNLATLGQLAGGIAHEMAQPLQAIMAASDSAALLLDRAADSEAAAYARARLAWISGQAERAGKTIQHLLAFSRGGVSGGSTTLSDAINGALELVGRLLDQVQIAVTIDLADNLPAVLGGTVEIEQVLVNLLLNARDALDGKDERQIRIACRVVAGAVVLEVSDIGGGIPANALSRVFEPFFTTKEPGRGTGLGLSIVQKTMAAVGGTVAVRNTARGAQFSLSFQSADELYDGEIGTSAHQPTA